MRRLKLLSLALAAAAALVPAVLPVATASAAAGSAASSPTTTRDISKIAAVERQAHSHALKPFATSGSSDSDFLQDFYPVGKTGGYAVDRFRGVAARYPNPASSVRTLPIEIWYPAYGTVSSSDSFWATARGGHFPLIVFAAGYNSNPDTYEPFLHALAAQGYIVAAPVFPIEASIAGAAPAGRSNAEMINQMYDMSATISQMLIYARTPGNWLGTAMSQTQIGVIGHSDGGMTVAGMTMSTSYYDSRIKAVAVMSGAGPYGLTWNQRKVVPTLVEQPNQDPYNSPSSSQWLFNRVTGSREYLTVAGPYHIWPLIGNDRTADLTRRAVIAHFNLILKHGGFPSFWQLVTAGNVKGFTALRFAS